MVFLMARNKGLEIKSHRMTENRKRGKLIAGLPLILIVEDDNDDAILLKRAIEELQIRADFHIVSGGTEAIAFLEKKGEFTNRTGFPRPLCVFIDLQMPGISGFDILKW